MWESSHYIFDFWVVFVNEQRHIKLGKIKEENKILSSRIRIN